MSLYDEVMNTATSYIGPAAQRFVDRQLDALGFDKAFLGPQHLDALGGRCYTSGKLLLNDDRAKEFSEKIKALGALR
jgi:hypothetical protein